MKTAFFLFTSILFTPICMAQLQYQTKLEASRLIFASTTITYDIDPMSEHKGHYLKDRNGNALSVISGIRNKNGKLFAGLGLSYLNFEGQNGMSVFTEGEFITGSKKFGLLGTSRIGYNHLWNHYEHGTGTVLIDFGLGVNYRINKKNSIYLKTGVSMIQQSALLPFSIGYRLN